MWDDAGGQRTGGLVAHRSTPRRSLEKRAGSREPEASAVVGAKGDGEPTASWEWRGARAGSWEETTSRVRSL